MNILFLCTGNSCRSILGEAIFNSLAPTGWHAMSAGSSPTGFVHPYSLALLQKKKISIEGLYSKSWDDLPALPDIVITVCSFAAKETCPVYPGSAIRTHWGVDDPAKVTGTDQQIEAAFDMTFQILKLRIEAFLALPITELCKDQAALKYELDRIGQLVV